ncbi:MAG: sodium:calcium antiporter [Patescibacteria group bacterium]|nr:sodium:calcium antiporter [Patescibacteria group bacterium]
MTILFLILGIAGLWIASEIAISGALDIADHFRISRGFIGLTVLAIGTDVPELFVNVTAAISRTRGVETSGFILGQIVGTCFGQVALMLGLVGLFATLTITRRKLLRDGLMLVTAAVLLFLLGHDGEISRMDGALLIVVYLVYFVSLIREEKIREKLHFKSKRNMLKAGVSLVGGLVLLGFAADITVENALALSVQWGIAQSVVGALIVGLGTSLPELATSLAALKKGHSELALGNLIGSTTFDMLVALGAAGLVSGLLVTSSILYFDLVMLILLTLLVFFVFWSRLRLSRREAAFLLIAYIIFAGAKLGGTV